FEQGEPIFAIGHPQGYEFSISEGIISGVRSKRVGTKIIEKQDGTKVEAPILIEEVQVTAPISPGNSGGPIFDSRGRVAAIATWIRVDKGSQNLNFGISGKEVFSIFAQNLKYKSLLLEKQERGEWFKKIAQQISERDINPSYKRLDQGLDPDPRIFGNFNVNFGGNTYKIFLPKNFLVKECIQERGTINLLVDCNDGYASGEGFILFDFVQATLGALEKSPKSTGEPVPLEAVKDLMRQGQWEKYEKTLTKQQKEYLFSKEGPWKCKSHQKSSFFLLDNAYTCQVSRYNAGLPNAASLTLFSQRSDSPIIVKIVAWTKEPHMGWYYFNVGSLAEIAIKKVKTSTKPLREEQPR
ncbi:MAG TPA: serine protease, partial [Bdellovibrionota bacterium]|nr:serine protease [Bdellovibrionota bacterium]